MSAAACPDTPKVLRRRLNTFIDRVLFEAVWTGAFGEDATADAQSAPRLLRQLHGRLQYIDAQVAAMAATVPGMDQRAAVGVLYLVGKLGDLRTRLVAAGALVACAGTPAARAAFERQAGPISEALVETVESVAKALDDASLLV